MIDDKIFERANDAIRIDQLVEKADGKLWGKGSTLRGICPLRQCGKDSGQRPFRCEPDEARWWCYSCGKGGDVVALEQLLKGGSMLEAAQRLLGRNYEPPPPRQPKTANEAATEVKRRIAYAAEVLKGAQPLLGSLGEKYLHARCIHPAVIAEAADRLMFHPSVRAKWSPDHQAWIRGPAIVAQVETTDGPTGGIHATFIAKDGSGRDKRLGKVMWGPQYGPPSQDGGPRRVGVAWLIGPVREGFDNTPLATGEGIETVLSIASIARHAGRRTRAVAALSLDRLQGYALPEDGKDQCFDLAKPMADLSRPAFTWPSPAEQPWPEVVAGIDRDMKPITINGRTGRGRAVPMELDAEARADLCARLVVQQWKAVGQDVRPALPPPNSDWNDELRRRVRRMLAREGV